MPKCAAITKAGKPCLMNALPNDDLCLAHSSSEYAQEVKANARRLGGLGKRKDKRIVGEGDYNGHKILIVKDGDSRTEQCVRCNRSNLSATKYLPACPGTSKFPDHPFMLEIEVVESKPYDPAWIPITMEKRQEIVEQVERKEMTNAIPIRAEGRPIPSIDVAIERLDIDYLMNVDGWWKTQDYSYVSAHEGIYALYNNDERWKEHKIAPKIGGVMVKAWPPESEKDKRNATEGFRQMIQDKIDAGLADPAFAAMERELKEYEDSIPQYGYTRRGYETNLTDSTS